MYRVHQEKALQEQYAVFFSLLYGVSLYRLRLTGMRGASNLSFIPNAETTGEEAAPQAEPGPSWHLHQMPPWGADVPTGPRISEFTLKPSSSVLLVLTERFRVGHQK